MTFPSGAPGGFPGQGPQQPHQSYPGAASRGGPRMALPQILLLVTAGLGVLNLFLGFAPLSGESSFYETHLVWVPALLLASGLAALLNVLPGDQKPGGWPAIFAVVTVLPFLFTVFHFEGDLAAGGIMIMVFGILQMIAAVAAYLFDTGIVRPPSPQSAPYGQPGAFGQQPGAYGQQPGGYGPQQQQSQPQQPQQSQQPAPDQSGGIPQPTKFTQPAPQQPTQYAAQQGQFFQQQSSSEGGGQQNNPGGQQGS